MRVAGTVLMAVHVFARSPWLKYGFSGLSFIHVRKLFRPAMATASLAAGNALNNQGILTLLSAADGPAAVLVYSTTRTLARAVLQLVNMITLAFVPELSTAYGSGRQALFVSLSRKVLVWGSCVAAGGGGLLAFLGPWIYTHWTRQKVSFQPSLFALLLGGAVLCALGQTRAVVAVSTNNHPRFAFHFLWLNVAALAAALWLPSLKTAGVAALYLGLEALMAGILWKVSGEVQTRDFPHPLPAGAGRG
jgi:O-antigen/teichoic acid export membrane protein